MVGINSVETQKGRIDIFSLFDEQKGLIGLNLIKSLKFNDLVMDVKVCKFFDEKSYLVVALKT